MSEVFHGYDERLDRRVAIKELRPPSAPLPAEPDSPEAAEVLDALDRDRKRFLREIRTTARLELPGAPAVYDTGEEVAADGSSRLWLVMQLLRGSTLEAVLDRADYVHEPPSVTWAAAVAAQIAAVLADVHRVDIVHRDIKPANVMIVDGGLVKVLDFGIAILRGGDALPRLTQVDKTVGTPPYMSPEQGLGQVVTAASDVYSLGCLLCELLTGDPPFLATADRSLRAHHLQSAAPSMRDRRAEVPAGLDDLVKAMLEKDPQDRPTAEAAYDTLVPLVARTEADARHEDRDPALPFRRPLLSTPPRRASEAAPESFTEAEFEQLSAAAEELLDNDRPAEAIRLLDEGLERAAHQPFLELRLRHFLAGALYYAGEYTRAAPLFDGVGRDYKRRLGPSDDFVIDAFYHAGHSYAEIGKPDKALPHLWFFLRHADGEDTDRVLRTRFVIAQMLTAADRPEDALDELRDLRPHISAAYGGGSTQVRNIDKHISRLIGR
ncbi:serine/threonine protein kinase [Pseudonocardia sp. MH-G8]|nr:serine/threonine protein kinase [Pseudonocardia sp. MH-G8]